MSMETLLNFVNLKHKNKMKQYILNITLLLTGLIGISQTTIKPIEAEWIVHYSERKNSYFKDINNVLDKFVGTWKYEDAITNTVFEMTFAKVLHRESRKNSFTDELSAQFKLSIDGIEQYNTYITPCESCFISTGFSSYEEGFENDEFVYTEPNSNMYVGAIAEPNIEQHVLSSNLKLKYQSNFGNAAQIIWTNKVEIGLDYNTNVRINNYQMPMNMVLIKQ